MIDAALLAAFFTQSFRDVQRSTAGISHNESLWIPPYAMRSLNWLVGYVVAQRTNVLSLLGSQNTLWNYQQARPYLPDSPALTAEEALPLSHLLESFERIHTQIDVTLQTALPALLEAPRGEDGRPVAWEMATYALGEAHLVGQIEMVAGMIKQARLG